MSVSLVNETVHVEYHMHAIIQVFDLCTKYLAVNKGR